MLRLITILIQYVKKTDYDISQTIKRATEVESHSESNTADINYANSNQISKELTELKKTQTRLATDQKKKQ